jgi:5-methylcytosine-specific restriction endonuclease McrA
MNQVLQLSASYEPLRIVPMKRAVLLVLKGKAEVIHEGEGELHSENTSFRMPSVIRLLKVVRIPYRSKIPLNRRAVIARDHGLCQYCFRPGDTIDHVRPKALGGKHVWENVVCACKRCNTFKDNKTLKELGWTLQTRPYCPTGTAWLVLGITARDESWEAYLSPDHGTLITI